MRTTEVLDSKKEFEKTVSFGNNHNLGFTTYANNLPNLLYKIIFHS